MTILSPAFVQVRDALAQVPFVAHIEAQDDYEQALELMFSWWKTTTPIGC